MSYHDDTAVIAAMIRYGGSFVRALGEAAGRADDENLKRIKGAFPELWQGYLELSQKQAERDYFTGRETS